MGQTGPLAAVGAAAECKAELHPGAAFHTFAFFKKPMLVLLLSEQKDKNRAKRKASQALQAAGPEGHLAFLNLWVTVNLWVTF